MKRVKLMATTICLLALTTVVGFAQTNGAGNSATASQLPADMAAQVRRLMAEVQALKVEVYKLRLTAQQTKVAQLERALYQLQADKQRLEEQEREFAGELVALDQYLGQSDLEPGERAALAQAKEQFTRNGPASFHAQRQQIAQQETELSQRLERERQHWRELVDKARELGIELGESGMNLKDIPLETSPFRTATEEHLFFVPGTGGFVTAMATKRFGLPRTSEFSAYLERVA
jgi:hypothetical protein